MNEETITITKKEYNSLVKDSQFLQYLVCCGVDNWQGYDEAVQMCEEQERFDEKI